MNQELTTPTNFENWQLCDVMDLARTFFAPNITDEVLSKCDQGQFIKVSQLAIGEKELSALLLEDLDPDQNSFTIEMGLQPGADGRKAFAPVFTVKNGTTVKSSVFKWKTKLLEDAAVIPHQLMTDLTNNWNVLENHLLDDVFMAKDSKSGTMKRLMSYHFNTKSNTANKAFYEYLYSLIVQKYTIQELILHLGVDYNKFNQIDRYSFSPIIEVKFLKPDDHLQALSESQLLSLHQLGVRFKTGFTTTEGSGYVEYISPCPSTCD